MSSPQTDSDDITRRRLQDLEEVLQVIRELVELDGGTIALTEVDVESGVVQVALAGACGACAYAGATVDQGVDRILRQRLDWVREVRATVEETSLESVLDRAAGRFSPRRD